VPSNSPRNLLKRHFEMMEELERLEKRMADLIQKLQDNIGKLEQRGLTFRNSHNDRRQVKSPS